MNEIKKAAITKFFMNFTQWHRPFIQELADRYKERGIYPFMPIYALPAMYQDRRDAEVAGYASLLVKDDEKRGERIEDIRHMLGESPWEWFEQRKFVLLSVGSEQEKRTAGIVNWRIAELFDKLHGKVMMHRINLLRFLVDGWKARLLLMVLGTSDGMGLGVIHLPECRILCPDSPEVVKFARLWLPELWKTDGGFTFDEAVRMYGLKRDVDFFYAYLGWQELCRRKPKECKRYLTLYQKRYDEGNMLGEKYWVKGRDSIVPIVEY